MLPTHGNGAHGFVAASQLVNGVLSVQLMVLSRSCGEPLHVVCGAGVILECVYGLYEYCKAFLGPTWLGWDL